MPGEQRKWRAEEEKTQREQTVGEWETERKAKGGKRREAVDCQDDNESIVSVNTSAGFSMSRGETPLEALEVFVLVYLHPLC